MCIRDSSTKERAGDLLQMWIHEFEEVLSGRGISRTPIAEKQRDLTRLRHVGVPCIEVYTMRGIFRALLIKVELILFRTVEFYGLFGQNRSIQIDSDPFNWRGISSAEIAVSELEFRDDRRNS